MHNISLICDKVLQLKIWHFCVIDIEINVCKFTFNR